MRELFFVNTSFEVLWLVATTRKVHGVITFAVISWYHNLRYRAMIFLFADCLRVVDRYGPCLHHRWLFTFVQFLFEIARFLNKLFRFLTRWQPTITSFVEPKPLLVNEICPSLRANLIHFHFLLSGRVFHQDVIKVIGICGSLVLTWILIFRLNVVPIELKSSTYLRLLFKKV